MPTRRSLLKSTLGYLAALPLVGRFVPSQPPAPAPAPALPILPKPTEYRRTLWAEPAVVPRSAEWLYGLALEMAGERARWNAEKAGCIVLGPAEASSWMRDVESPEWHGLRDVAMACVPILEPVKDTPPRDGRC